MNQEIVLLTQQVHSTYARREGFSMSTTAHESQTQDQQAPEARVHARAFSEQSEERSLTPDQRIERRVKKWREKVAAKRVDALKQAGFSQQEIDKRPPTVAELSKDLKFLDPKEIHGFLEDLKEIQQALEEAAKGQASDIKPKLEEIKKEVKQYEEKVEAEVKEQVDNTLGKELESADIGGKVSVGGQVVEQFAKYLSGDDIVLQTNSGSSEVTITERNGKKVISIPEPTLENMLAVAKQLNSGALSPETSGNILQMAKDLKMAAAYLDSSAIFGPDAILRLYNAGAQLEAFITRPDTYKIDKESYLVTKYDQLQRKFRELGVDVSREGNKLFMDMLMGRHDLSSTPGIDAKRTFYDVYFKRWQSLLARSDKETDRMLLKRLDAAKTPAEKQKLYDEWLEKPENQQHVLRMLKNGLERSLREGGKAGRLIATSVQGELAPDMNSPEVMAKLLERWKELASEDEFGRGKMDAAKELVERFRGTVPFDEVGLAEALFAVNNFFQPGEKQAQDLLKYIPAELRGALSHETRDAIACIVAASFEQKVLQDSLGPQYAVMAEITGVHATLLVIDLSNPHTIFRVDPSAPKGKGREGVDGGVTRLDPQSELAISIKEYIKGQVDKKDSEKTPEVQLRSSLKKRDVKKLFVQVRDGEGTHTVSVDDKVFQAGYLVTMAADTKYLKEKIADPKERQELRIAATAKALEIVPYLPVGMAVMARLQQHKGTEDLMDLSAYYKKQVQELDSSLSGKDLKDLRVGYWGGAVPPGAWPASGAFGGGAMPAEYARVITPYETIMGAGGDLTNLTDEQIRELYGKLQNVYQGYNFPPGDPRRPGVQPIIDFGEARLAQVQDELANRGIISRLQTTEGSRIAVFNLTADEINLFAGTNVPDMRAKIEGILHFFGTKLNPGFNVPGTDAQISQARFEDIIKLLNANPRRDINTDLGQQLERVRLLADRYSKIVIYPSVVASAIESGDPRQIEQARDNANKMDTTGGHEAMAALMELHDGRAHMLSEELWREMSWMRESKATYEYDNGQLKKVSVPVITPPEYRTLQKRVVERHVEEALNGRGMYVAERIATEQRIRNTFVEDYRRQNNGANPPQNLVDQQVQRNLRSELYDSINLDANFAHLEFIIDKRASAIGILGFDTKIFDGSAMPFIDAQKHDVDRYDIFTESRLKIYKAIRNARVKLYVRLRFGDRVLRDLESNPNAFERYAEQNGFELLGPSVDGLWENQFLFVKPQLYAIKEWREQMLPRIDGTVPRDLDHASDDVIRQSFDTQYGLFLKLLTGESYIRPGGYLFSDRPEDTDPLMRYIYRRYVNTPENAGTLERISKIGDRQTAFNKNFARFGLMQEVISKFFPDELLKPFASEPDYSVDRNGGRFDPRFEAFFSGNATAFLENLQVLDAQGQPVNVVAKAEDELRRRFGPHYDNLTDQVRSAQIRFHIFQNHIAPLLTSIRTYRMNGINPNLLAQIQVQFGDEVRAQLETDGRAEIPPGSGNVVELPREAPRQTDFGAMAFVDFNTLGNNVAEAVRQMMGGMTNAVRQENGTLQYLDRKVPNSIIGRLAFDPMMEHVLYKSPRSLVDVPYWMLHGKAPFRQIENEEHPSSVSELFGGVNQVGRYLGSAALSNKIRTGIIKVVMGNPNDIEESMLKPLAEEVVQSTADMKSKEFAEEIEASVAGELLHMMVSSGELVGLEAQPWFKNSDMRKIFGKRTRGMNEEQLKTIYWSQYAPKLIKDEYRAAMYELLFGNKLKRSSRRVWKILFTIFISAIEQTLLTGAESFTGEVKAA